MDNSVARNQDDPPEGQPNDTGEPNFQKNRTQSWLSAMSRVGIALVFVISTIFAVVAALKSAYSLGTKLWLGAGWLLGAAVVLTATLNAQRKLHEADERKQELRAKGKPTSGKAIDDDAVPAVLTSNVVVFFVSGLTVVSFCTAGDRCGWAASMIWSMATLVIGGIVGFLFGIPRTAETTAEVAAAAAAAAAKAVSGGISPGDPPNKAVGKVQRPIEDIADWLTKTIVGIGLVNLKQIPGYLRHWADYVGTSMCVDRAANCGLPGRLLDPTAFVLGFLLYFACFGFLAGYLLTQLFLKNWVNQ